MPLPRDTRGESDRYMLLSSCRLWDTFLFVIPALSHDQPKPIYSWRLIKQCPYYHEPLHILTDTTLDMLLRVQQGRGQHRPQRGRRQELSVVSSWFGYRRAGSRWRPCKAIYQRADRLKIEISLQNGEMGSCEIR